MIHRITGLSVNEVYEDLAKLFATEIVDTGTIKSNTINRSSRAGDVHELRGLCVLEYQRPELRVLFCPIRDANPYFHLMEAMWMLAGRCDVEFLAKYSKQASGLIIGSASYGHRWRNYFEFDQIAGVINMLKQDPGTRRAFLAMWDAQHDLGSPSKDIPCNVGIKFEIRDGLLEMCVFNRSNDAIWGACGANVVHMSFLQEYIAQMVGVPMGSYFQISGNMHVYSEVYQEKMRPYRKDHSLRHFYANLEFESLSLVNHVESFDTELKSVLEDATSPRFYRNRFLGDVVRPCMLSWDAWKAKDYDGALNHALTIHAVDWATAMTEWLFRHAPKKNA